MEHSKATKFIQRTFQGPLEGHEGVEIIPVNASITGISKEEWMEIRQNNSRQFRVCLMYFSSSLIPDDTLRAHVEKLAECSKVVVLVDFFVGHLPKHVNYRYSNRYIRDVDGIEKIMQESGFQLHSYQDINRHSKCAQPCKETCLDSKAMPKVRIYVFVSKYCMHEHTIPKDLFEGKWETLLQSKLSAADTIMGLDTAHFIDGLNDFKVPAANGKLISEQIVREYAESCITSERTIGHYRHDCNNFFYSILPVSGYERYFRTTILMLFDEMRQLQQLDNPQSKEPTGDQIYKEYARPKVLSFNPCQQQNDIQVEILAPHYITSSAILV